MLKLNHKTILICVLLFISINAFSQTTNRLKERIKTFKKIKLIDALDLSEEKSDKMMIKYNAYQIKIDEKNIELDKAVQELENVSSNKNSKIEIVKMKSNNLLKLQNELYLIIQERDKEMKAIFSDLEFAKYLVFERKFSYELRKSLMHLNKKRFE